MTETRLFDRKAILRNRARAEQIGMVDFLHQEALFEIQERLIDVNRRFTAPAIVTAFPRFWREAFPDARVITDDEVLDLEPGAHDLVIHAMALHVADDPVGQLVQCRHALKPDGLMLACLLGGQTLSELRASLGQAEISLTEGLSPRVVPMAEIRDLGSVLQRSGLALPVADTVKREVIYRTPLHLLHDLRAMGEGNPLIERSKKFSPRDLFAEMARIYNDAYAKDDGTVRATFELIFLTGWMPDESQPQPLRPGSATTRLADFLNTTELGTDAKPVNGDKD